MRITVITASYLPMTGGMQNVVHSLVQEWKKMGHSIKILANRSNRHLMAEEIIEGIPIRRDFFVFVLPSLRPMAILKYLILLLYVPRTLWRLWKELIANPPDVVHVHLHLRSDLVFYLCLFSFFSRPPWFVTIHGVDEDYGVKKRRINDCLTSLLLNRSQKVTTVSRSLGNLICRFHPQIRSSLVTIPNGIDPEIFIHSKPFVHRSTYLVCVGRMTDKIKGQDVLIEAFGGLSKECENLDLILAGNGPFRPQLQEMVGTLGLGKRVLFYGNASQKEVAALLKGSRLVVVPSIREPFGLVCLEGACVNRPIVASQVDGMLETLQGYSMVQWVKPGSVESLREGIAVALKKYPARGGDSSIPEAFLKKFRWPEIAREYVKVFTL
jgi:glycogen synthase